MTLVRRGLALAAAVVGASCATPDRPLQLHLQSPAAHVRECAEWYQALDRSIDEAGVRDAQYTRIAGFPYARTDRILSSLKGKAAANELALQALADRFVELDMEARAFEIANLPRARLEDLPDAPQRPGRVHALQRTRDCARLLREIDLAKPEARAALLAQAEVPDDYSGARRLLGLYPLTRLAFSRGVQRWEEKTRAAFRDPPSLPQGASLVRYAPPPGPPLPRTAVAAMLARAYANPLGLPALGNQELGLLALAYAPSFEISMLGDYDRFGQLRWRRGAMTPEVDASVPAVYVLSAYARYGNQVLLQLVYTIWFPERPAQDESDVLAGRLDGITWRVTLAPDGEPLIYDSIHPCGCYHEFFPTPRARARPAPDALEEWAFVPQALPRVEEGQRPVIRIASGTHYLERVGLVRGTDSLVRYTMRDYGELRSMPDFAGGARSAFGPDGLIAGTERAERLLFWPMGIVSPGAMRQWGRQATAFVGRRHFDDADLLERRFELDVEPEAVKAAEAAP